MNRLVRKICVVCVLTISTMMVDGVVPSAQLTGPSTLQSSYLLPTLPVVPAAPLPGVISPLPPHLLPIAGVAFVTLLGSWAAFARGAFSLQRERRPPRLPFI